MLNRQARRASSVSHQSVSKVVAELEHCGYVIRTPNPRDRREYLIALSPEGAASLQKERHARRDAIARAAATLSPLEQHVLACVPELLTRLSQAIAEGDADAASAG